MRRAAAAAAAAEAAHFTGNMSKKAAPVCRSRGIKEMGVGESDFTGPNIVHRHGAAQNVGLTHVAVGFGGETRWLEKVTDAECAGKAKP